MLSLDEFKASLTLPSPLILFKPNWEGASKVSLYVKRDDAIHPVMSGNKWRKLSHALTSPLPSAVISFGGGFSNHLHALGFACYKLGIPFTAIIRGDYSAAPSPMIKDLMQWNTHIEYVNRITYKKRNDSAYLDELKLEFPNAIVIPEGGSQALALQGIKDMVDEIEVDFDFIITPVASGATLAGIVSALNKRNSTTGTDFRSRNKAIGIGVLKGEGYLEELVEHFLPIFNQTNWHIEHRYHFGGYAKAPSELQTFCNDFNNTMDFEIEPVYSGKAFWAVKDMLAKGMFEDGSRIVILHTGGLQGAR
ncbi:pyridoxal-phosphate dependent enzyme [Alteromonas sp. BL110]|uniref:1-aminocyclopropane-1-carboxylate deaminase/D-cysteine desulfhydrase n=1 Tax=Alteromonas sp. BL110 TaxID=1714845 RepID=UPI000E50051E|nr:pyridoxal-phosphate dependent enzyme [Alteromonas sp. BL110]AXT39397.1 pyridoxal-phosphate dependent enzyme [Alteromonas sp. BL110]RKM82117.1 pyridoxal-phosphate dependent enzyme [Alteromonas sp. BL110]